MLPDYFDKNPQKIHDWISKTEGEIINTSTAAIGQTLVIVGSMFGCIVFTSRLHLSDIILPTNFT